MRATRRPYTPKPRTDKTAIPFSKYLVTALNEASKLRSDTIGKNVCDIASGYIPSYASKAFKDNVIQSLTQIKKAYKEIKGRISSSRKTIPDSLFVMQSILTTASREFRNLKQRLMFVHYCLFVLSRDDILNAQQLIKRLAKPYAEVMSGIINSSQAYFDGENLIRIPVNAKLLFKWPSTVCTGNDSGLRPADEATLNKLGYNVGLCSVLNDAERRLRLDAYILECSARFQATSIVRLKIVSHLIAVCIRRARGHKYANYAEAICQWEDDLGYLKSKYYDLLIPV